MKSDFELLTYDFEPHRDFKIIPVADVHLGAAEHMEREWRQFCDTVVNQPDTYLVLGGDLLNNNTRSAVGNPFTETLRPRDQKRRMIEMLTPIRDRILAGTMGNHEARSWRESDVDLIYDVFCKLDIEDRYRQNLAVIKIRTGKTRTENSHSPAYIIGITHGAGGGIYTGAAINRAERYGYYFDGLDALIVSHTHKAFVSQPAKIKVDPYNNKLSLLPFKVVSCTSWMEYAGYAMGKMLQPSSHAPQTMYFSGKKKQITVTM